MVTRRIYLSGEDISAALLNAGIELRPEDCLMTKFSSVAEELSKKVREDARRELDKFSADLCWELYYWL